VHKQASVLKSMLYLFVAYRCIDGHGIDMPGGVKRGFCVLYVYKILLWIIMNV